MNGFFKYIGITISLAVYVLCFLALFKMEFIKYIEFNYMSSIILKKLTNGFPDIDWIMNVVVDDKKEYIDILGVDENGNIVFLNKRGVKKNNGKITPLFSSLVPENMSLDKNLSYLIDRLLKNGIT
jgi:hypothetical protein